MVSIKNSLFQGVFQNMNRCSIWWLFVPRVCNGVGIIVTKNWIESLLTVPIWDRKTFATERDRKRPHAGYACPLGRNSPSLVNYSYMRLDNQRQVQMIFVVKIRSWLLWNWNNSRNTDWSWPLKPRSSKVSKSWFSLDPPLITAAGKNSYGCPYVVH